jgi:hypothetical protein
MFKRKKVFKKSVSIDFFAFFSVKSFFIFLICALSLNLKKNIFDIFFAPLYSNSNLKKNETEEKTLRRDSQKENSLFLRNASPQNQDLCIFNGKTSFCEPNEDIPSLHLDSTQLNEQSLEDSSGQETAQEIALESQNFLKIHHVKPEKNRKIDLKNEQERQKRWAKIYGKKAERAVSSASYQTVHLIDDQTIEKDQEEDGDSLAEEARRRQKRKVETFLSQDNKKLPSSPLFLKITHFD